MHEAIKPTDTLANSLSLTNLKIVQKTSIENA